MHFNLKIKSNRREIPNMNNDVLSLLLGDDTANEGVTTLENPEDRSFVILAALQEACTEAEYNALMNDESSRRALELFQVIPNADTAMEAVEKRIARYSMTSKLSQATKATCLRMAKASGDPNYEKYRKARLMMFDYREKIYTKYNSKATRVAKDIIRGARNNSSAMKTKAGEGISEKLDRTVKRLEKEGK